MSAGSGKTGPEESQNKNLTQRRKAAKVKTEETKLAAKRRKKRKKKRKTESKKIVPWARDKVLDLQV
jgi:hypothetical protein